MLFRILQHSGKMSSTHIVWLGVNKFRRPERRISQHFPQFLQSTLTGWVEFCNYVQQTVPRFPEVVPHLYIFVILVIMGALPSSPFLHVTAGNYTIIIQILNNGSNMCTTSYFFSNKNLFKFVKTVIQITVIIQAPLWFKYIYTSSFGGFFLLWKSVQSFIK